MTADDALRVLVRVLAPELARLVAAELRAPTDTLDQRSAALAELGLTPRAYLERARRKDFVSVKRGRLVCARRADVVAALEGRAAPAPEQPAKAPARDPDDELRAELGLKPKLRAVSGGKRSR